MTAFKSLLTFKETPELKSAGRDRVNGNASLLHALTGEGCDEEVNYTVRLNTVVLTVNGQVGFIFQRHWQ